jgi:hypothetical protein
MPARNQEESPETVERVLAESIQALPNPAQWLLILLAAFPNAAFGRQAALTLAHAVRLESPEDQLNLLVRHAFLERSLNPALPEGSDGERLRLDPLLREFLAARFARWAPSIQKTARQAVATYYASYVSQASPAALELDEANISGALVWAQAQGQSDLAAPLSKALEEIAQRRASVQEQMPQPAETEVDAILTVLERFLQTSSWEEMGVVLEREQALLLSDKADQVLTAIVAQALQSNDAKNARYLRIHRALLRRAREVGIHPALLEFRPDQ